MDIKRVVGKNIRRYRIEAELSQKELAAGMSVEQGYVRRLEAGKRNPTIVRIWRAAEALDVSPAALFRTCSKRSQPTTKRTRAPKILWEI
jgi:transcriptional regulator with XRE-family HTH domain